MPATCPPAFAPRRELGRTGFIATRLGIGDLADRALPKDTLVTTLHRTMDAGLNVIDTAPSYEQGYSEEVVGAALAGRREGMFVIDKVDHLHQPVRPQVEESLKRLQLDHTDLFAFHAVSTLDDWHRLIAPGGGFDQLAECMQSGMTRWRGISSHHPDVLAVAVPSGLCDVVLFPVGPYVHPRYVDEILPLAKKHGVGTVCFKTFGAGKLLGDTTGYNQPLAARPRGKFSSGGKDGHAPGLPHLSVTECVRYTLTLDPDVTLLGLSFPNEQEAAFTAAQNFTPLSPSEISVLRQRAGDAIVGKGPCWWNPEGR